MSPATLIDTREPHRQRPWRPVDLPPRRASRTTERAFRTPVVRELPPRRERREPVDTW